MHIRRTALIQQMLDQKGVSVVSLRAVAGGPSAITPRGQDMQSVHGQLQGDPSWEPVAKGERPGRGQAPLRPPLLHFPYPGAGHGCLQSTAAGAETQDGPRLHVPLDLGSV